MHISICCSVTDQFYSVLVIEILLLRKLHLFYINPLITRQNEKKYYTPQLRFHRLRINAVLQASGPSNARIGIEGSNYGGGFVMEYKGYSSYDFDEDEE